MSDKDNVSSDKIDEITIIKDKATKYDNLTKKIKDKIEEIDKAYEDSKDEYGESEYYYPDYTINILEELLESEE